jgi:lysozyme family protein
MADFNIAFEITCGPGGHEGGYVNNPNDPGKETYRGISRKNWPEWQGWEMVDAIKAKNPDHFKVALTNFKPLNDLVCEFYKENFWNKNNLSKISWQPIANEIFDFGVNAGDVKAAMFLQQALNYTNENQKLYPDMVVDGIIGPNTIATTNNHPRLSFVFNVMNGLQFEHYIERVRKNPVNEEFLRGWSKRVELMK